jgi:hypothetical protein
MTMKKNKVLMGLLSVLLMAGILFTACPMNSDDDDDDGLSVPGPGDLPSLPSDTTAITTKAEAEELLGKLDGFKSVFFQAQGVVETAHDAEYAKLVPLGGSGSYEVTDNTSVTGLKINSTGSFSVDISGTEWEGSDESETTVDFIDDVAGESTAIVYKDSVLKFKAESSSTFGASGYEGQGTDFQVFGLTVSTGTDENKKGGKVILDTKTTYEDNGDTETGTYEGSLTVYGKDDAELYTLEIKDEASYNKALGYFDID